jgi:hypothetical protein
MEYRKLAIESYEIIKVKETNLNLIKLKNVTLFPHPTVTTKKDPVVINGKTFISLFHYHYHHFLIDTVAQYEFIKKYVPELNIEFLARDAAYLWRKKEDLSDYSPQLFIDYIKTKHFGSSRDVIDLGVEQHKYFEGIFNMYNKSKNKLIYSDITDNIVFEEVYFLVDDFEFFQPQYLKEIGLTENEIPWLSPEWKTTSGSKLFESWGKLAWEHDGIRCASKVIKPLIKKDTKSPKKIYISRQLANKRYIEEKSKLDFWAVDKNLKARVFEEEDQLEDFFVKNGYTSVTLEGTPFLEQMQLFYNATHIASLSGSGLVNIIGCDVDAKIIEIRAIKQFAYNYHDYARALGLQLKLIDLPSADKRTCTIEEEMAKYIDEI